MDRMLMDEYYEKLRADDIEALAMEYIDDYNATRQGYDDAVDVLLESLNLQDLFNRSRKLSPEEKILWKKFDSVSRRAYDCLYELMKGAYMVGAADRDRMLR